MDRFKHVVLGGGMVAGHAAKAMVKQGLEPGELCIVSMDEDPPYERPPLSKGLMREETEEAEVFINDPGFYEENGVEVILNAWVKSVDLEARELSSKSTTVGFENLLIATGAWPNSLSIPGFDLDGVHLLRTLAQSKDIHAAAGHADRAVVIGAGFIGMEMAASLTMLGVDCAMVYREDQVMAGRFTDPISDYFEQYYADRGVRLMPGASVASLEGDERVTGVTLDSGETIDADMVVAGVGVSPETGLFEDGPIEVDDGIVTNEFLETGVEGVWAAGDVARYHDVLFDRARRFEHEDNAIFQGKRAGRAMLGDRKPFKHVPHFYSDMFDLSWNYWGDRWMEDAQYDVSYRGEVDSGEFIAWWTVDDRVMAAFTLGIGWKEAKPIADIIKAGKEIPEDVLTDESRELEELAE
ncbi:MAG: NAD(P)/FAD-dependent oxidoreductase [Armatimonadia bacterium]|nr:NAD(P)/FAD-dependent oxidoreductase [Armatimonadia bacterium]